jgi:hypothetical protein
MNETIATSAYMQPYNTGAYIMQFTPITQYYDAESDQVYDVAPYVEVTVTGQNGEFLFTYDFY